jgi:DMSO/TMAO reductase YedYZ molybdopterin-dependent catalytic subunit
MNELRSTRRHVLRWGVTTIASIAAAGCDRLAATPSFRAILDSAESLTQRTQRLLVGPQTLAREYGEADISPLFKANGTTEIGDEEYVALAAEGFANWRLQVSGLVERPLQLSLADLRAMPSRTQITRHDCVEGWSCIGKWKGVPLARVLEQAGLKPDAKYIVFRCADTMEVTFSGAAQYYESIAIEDALHPQTLLAYDMNDRVLPVPHGAPLRLRVERQLGYKMAKYIMAIEAVDTFAAIEGGKGGYWEDRGYEWYAGI